MDAAGAQGNVSAPAAPLAAGVAADRAEALRQAVVLSRRLQEVITGTAAEFLAHVTRVMGEREAVVRSLVAALEVIADKAPPEWRHPLAAGEQRVP